ncbi:MAG: POTRA domain-containing protein [Bacteroidota bacterium]|nr:POTRA domain-containing protein [Bacteroidota bacterium]
MKKFYLNIFFLILIGNNFNLISQSKIDFGNQYMIGGISFSGNSNLDSNTILSLIDLKVGDNIFVPGEEIPTAIKNLWKQNMFSDIQIFQTKTEGNIIFLEIYLDQLPKLEKFQFKGLKKSEIDKLREELNLSRGIYVSNQIKNKTENYIIKYFKEKGFLNVTCSVNEETSQDLNSSTLIIDVNKNERVKIKKITISSDENTFKQGKLKRQFKNTKETGIKNIFSSSKFIESDFDEDLQNLISMYGENGYRDAKIIGYKTSFNNNGELLLNIEVTEGEKYFFGDIKWIGNSKYDSEKLNELLSIKEGEIFDQKLLEERLFMSRNGNDISSLYMDDGYLFFQANPVESSIIDQKINLEIRINEGKRAIVNNVTVVGNTKVKDHVIMREVRSLPGSMFKRSDIIRTQEEFNRLGYFNPETLGVNPVPDPETGTVDIEYSVESKSSDQLELQGGWGNGMVVGAFSVVFNNFSTKNFFKKDNWNPMPHGDGQKIRLRAASNGSYYQNYSLSFEEPWMGGAKPNSFSVSLWKTIQSFNEGSKMDISGLSIGFGKRLNWPDDYFTITHSVNFQRYNLENYQTSLFDFSDGFSNNINYATTFSRNSIFNPIYPRNGSKFTLYFELTPPYSLFKEKDYYKNLDDDQERYKFLEYNKFKFDGTWYNSLIGDLVIRTHFEFGFLGTYNQSVGLPPFERFFVGGDGLSGYSIDGREIIALRGYPNGALSSDSGDALYNKYNLELRYPISLNPNSTIYGLLFTEAGNSWTNYDNFNPFELKRSAGLGLRIFMPMFGLLGLDFAHGFDNLSNSNIKSGWQTHFIIGQQF